MRDTTKAKATDQSFMGLPEWMIFPAIAEAFTPTPSQAIMHLTAKAKEYRRRSAAGSAMERVRDRVIAESYDRTSALLRDLEEQRLNVLRKEATIVTGKR